MDLTTYERLVKTENAARKYLLGFCFENHQRFYPRCKGKKLYRLADDRRRCSSCRYTFHDFSSRWINQGNHGEERVSSGHRDYDYLEWIARLTSHIPDRGTQLVH